MLFPTESVGNWSYQGFMTVTDELLESNAEYARQSIDRITASPFLPKKDSVRGFVLDVATGKPDEVK